MSTCVKVGPPAWAKTSGAKGSRSRGHTYERKVGKYLKRFCDSVGWELHDHQWFLAEGKYFQPDFIMEAPSGAAIVVEAKLTLVDTRAQLQTYLKYLTAFGLRCVPLTIVRHLVPHCQPPVTELESISPNSVLHLWL